MGLKSDGVAVGLGGDALNHALVEQVIDPALISLAVVEYACVNLFLG